MAVIHLQSAEVTGRRKLRESEKSIQVYQLLIARHEALDRGTSVGM
jgi:hypothetical protein